LLEVDHVGDYLDIAIDDGVEVCRGDLLALDAQARTITDALGLPRPDPHPIAVWATQDVVLEYCPTGGCALEQAAVAENFSILLHEVGHLAARPLGRTRMLWEEGLAEAFTPGPLSRSDDHPAAMLERTISGPEYDQAGLFSRWLWRTLSPATVIEIYRRSPWSHADAAAGVFERIVGASIVDMGDRFIAEVPGSLPSLGPADPDPLPWQDDLWHHVVTVDCDGGDDSHVGWFGGYARGVVVEIATPGSYEVETSAESYMLHGLDEPMMESGNRYVVQRFDLAAGRYRLDLIVPTRARTDVFVQVRPQQHRVPVQPPDE
jgi:hypothetical protein